MQNNHSQAVQNAAIQATTLKRDIKGRALEDRWVTSVLKALSNTQYSECLISKSVTSLNKVWNLINSFNEYIFNRRNYPSWTRSSFFNSSMKKRLCIPVLVFYAISSFIEMRYDSARRFAILGKKTSMPPSNLY